jgi:hypothetical protein
MTCMTRVLGLTAVLASCLAAQNVISARSGLIHYVEGDVTLNGEPVVVKAATFPEMKDGQELRTRLGRAEVLLAPGCFLRISEDTSIRLVSGRIEDTRLQLAAGSALLEIGEFDRKEQAVTVLVGDTAVEVQKRGLYRIDANPPQLRVHDGSAEVVAGGQSVTIREGRESALTAAIGPEKFDKEKGDPFLRWAARRSGYIATANMAAAKRVYDDSTPWRVSGWMYDPYFGAFTFIPATGLYRSPFGYAYYSPRAIQSVYYRPPEPVHSGGGWAGGGFGDSTRSYPNSSGRGSMGGYSSAAPSVSAPPPAAAPAPAGGARTGGGNSAGSRSAGSGR